MKQRGFTLIELLVVITIIGVISSIVLVNLKGTREKAKIAKSLSFSQSVNNALGAYAVGVWNFEKVESGTNLTPDLSGYNNHGTVHGAVLTDGIIRNALYFDGVDDYIEIPNAGSLNPTKITVEAWINSKSFGSYDGIITKYDRIAGQDDGSFNLQIYPVQPYGRIYFRIDVEPETYGQWYYKQVTTNFVLSENQWHHVVGTYDGVVHLRLYIDGVEAANCEPGGLGTCSCNTWLGGCDPKNLTGPLNSNVGNVHIGIDHPDYDNMFNGLIDEVRIYSEALTAGEIQRHYVEGLERHKLVEK